MIRPFFIYEGSGGLVQWVYVINRHSSSCRRYLYPRRRGTGLFVETVLVFLPKTSTHYVRLGLTAML